MQYTCTRAFFLKPNTVKNSNNNNNNNNNSHITMNETVQKVPQAATAISETTIASGELVPSDVMDPKEYAPETKKMIEALAAMSEKSPQWLTRALYQSLFGDPNAATDTVRLWCRSMQRAQMQNALAPLLAFLATAPAMPCVEQHAVGGRERYAVFFLPFGHGSRFAQTLKIPLSVADLRVIRAVQLLATNPWVFPHMPQDPVFGFVTYTNFVYTVEAQRKLDQCRPILLAAAVRAITMQLRLDIFWMTSSTVSRTRPQGLLPRARTEALVLARPPTYTQATVEADILRSVRKHVRSIQQNRQNKLPPERRQVDQLSFRLLRDAMEFVLLDNVGINNSSMVQKHKQAEGDDGHGSTQFLGRHVPEVSQPYVILPDDKQIMAFAQESTGNWIRAITQARAAMPVGS